MDVTRLIVMIAVCHFFRRTTALPLDLDDSEEEDSYSTALIKMGHNLEHVPQGQLSIVSANFAYNSLPQLPPYVFYVNLYSNLETLQLGHNNISDVDLLAFRGMRHLKYLDLSHNNIGFFEPNVFKQNPKLEKLDLAFNSIVLDPEKPLLRSQSLETLILSHNQIIHLYDINFARLPNLRTVLLNNNPLYYLSPYCFSHLKYLQYVSLASTEVLRLKSTMFRAVPRLMDLSRSNLSEKFDPPLRYVKSADLVTLMQLEKDVSEDDYDESV